MRHERNERRPVSFTRPLRNASLHLKHKRLTRTTEIRVPSHNPRSGVIRMERRKRTKYERRRYAQSSNATSPRRKERGGCDVGEHRPQFRTLRHRKRAASSRHEGGSHRSQPPRVAALTEKRHLSIPVAAIKFAERGCLRHVFRSDRLRPVKVGNRAGNLQHAVVGAGREVELREH